MLDQGRRATALIRRPSRVPSRPGSSPWLSVCGQLDLNENLRWKTERIAVLRFHEHTACLDSQIFPPWKIAGKFLQRRRKYKKCIFVFWINFEPRPSQILSCSAKRVRNNTMAKHHPDLIMCRKQPGIAIGRLCEKCDGKCVICDSYVRCVPPFSIQFYACANPAQRAVSHRMRTHSAGAETINICVVRYS